MKGKRWIVATSLIPGLIFLLGCFSAQASLKIECRSTLSEKEHLRELKRLDNILKTDLSCTEQELLDFSKTIETKAPVSTVVPFGPTTSFGDGILYLGAGEIGHGDASLVSAGLKQRDDGSYFLDFTPLGGSTDESPLKNQKIDLVARFGNITTDTNPGIIVGAGNKLYFLNPDGSEILSPPMIYDNNGNPLEDPLAISKVVSDNKKYFFTLIEGQKQVVPSTSGTTSGTTSAENLKSLHHLPLRSISGFTSATSGLASTSEITAGTLAEELVNPAIAVFTGGGGEEEITQITQNPLFENSALGIIFSNLGIPIAKATAFFYSPKLKVLYVSFGKYVETIPFDETTGKLSSPVPFLQQAPGANNSNPNVESFEKNIKSLEVQNFVPHKPYPTTTGKNCIVGTNIPSTKAPHGTQVIALPVMPVGDGVGQLAKIDADGVFALATEAPEFGPAHIVGGGDLGETVQDLIVVGDTVFIALAGGIPGTRGVFSSTALFDKYGNIRAWTQWQRTQGITQAAYRLSANKNSGGIIFLTTEDGLPGENKTIVRATAWGESSDIGQGNFSTIVKIIFKGNTRLHAFSFNEKTPGFKQDAFSMMIVVGGKTVAIFQTGTTDADGNFIPVTDFELDKNVFIFSGDPNILWATNPLDIAAGGRNKYCKVLSEIGPLTSATITPNDTDPDGARIYVGGEKGVACLQREKISEFDENSKSISWDNVAGLLQLSNESNAFPGGGDLPSKRFTFKRINGFNEVIKLMGGPQSLVVTERYSVKKTDLNGVIQTSPAIDKKTSLSIAFGEDMLIINGMGLIAGMGGLFITRDFVTKTRIVDVPVVSMYYLSEIRGTSSEKGNLYIITQDFFDAVGEGMRFSVDTTAENISDILTNIDARGKYIDCRGFQYCFVAGEGVAFHSSGNANGGNFLRLIPTDPSESTVAQIVETRVKGLDGNSIGYPGKIIRDTHGNWIVPGLGGSLKDVFFVLG
jgi:hypothetical protein